MLRIVQLVYPIADIPKHWRKKEVSAMSIVLRGPALGLRHHGEMANCRWALGQLVF